MTSPARSSPRARSNPPALGIPAEEALRLYTADEAARLLQVSASWLRKKASARAIPCTFVGRYLRFSAADLAEIIRRGAQHTAPSPRASAR